MTEPIIIGSDRSEVGLPAGMALLRAGKSAIDAVEAALWACEDNLEDHYVGTGGLPNARGVVELDASMMVGSTRAFGAVGAVRGFRHPISIARGVIEKLPQHCLLVGEGAEQFADELGLERAELLTEEAHQLYLDALRDGEDPATDHDEGPVSDGDRLYTETTRALMRRLAPHDGPWGTINVIALDGEGEMCVGVSTSGYPWKYPGRVGDSALPGAGNYCDLRAGGAACTGRGEMAMRASSARQIVDLLRSGMDPSAACAAMLEDAFTLVDPFAAELRSIALTPDGRHGGAAGRPGAKYALMTASSREPELLPRLLVARPDGASKGAQGGVSR